MVGNKFYTLYVDENPDNRRSFYKYLMGFKAKSAQQAALTLKKIGIETIEAEYEKRVEALVQKNGYGQTRNTFTNLLKKYKEFLVLQAATANPDIENCLLAVAAKTNRNVGLQLHLTEESRARYHQDNPIPNIWAYELMKRNVKEDDIEKDLYQNVERELLYHFQWNYSMTEKIKLICEFYYFNSHRLERVPQYIVNEALRLIELYHDGEESLFLSDSKDSDVLFLTLKLLVHEDQKDFEELMRKVVELSDELDSDIFQLALRSGGRYSVFKFNEGEEEYRSIYHETVKLRTKRDDIEINETELISFVFMLCKNGEFAEAELLTKNRIRGLKPAFRPDAENLCMATICLYRKEYDRAISYLNQIGSSSSHYLISRFRLLKLHYDLKNYDLLNSMVKSFRVFLIRNKEVSDINKRTFKNFLTALSQLVKIRSEVSYVDCGARIEKLRGFVVNTKNILNREWFQAEIDKIVSSIQTE